jgi:hypothetical protein
MSAQESRVLRTAPLATPTDLKPNAVRDLAGELNILLADMFGLYLKTKNFHWHVSGPHFRDYHLLLDEQGEQIFATTDAIAERVRKIGVVTAKNKRITDVIAKLLDGPAWLRRYVIEKVIVEGYRFDQLMHDDEALEDFIRKAAIGVWHATCTCHMGADADPMAVTDNQGRVRGVGGLRVVDASLFPVVPCANTNFPTLMTAEKIADAMVAAL